MSSKKPEIAIGMRKTPIGWQVVQYQIQGGKIVKEVASEPNLRAIALERVIREMSIFWED